MTMMPITDRYRDLHKDSYLDVLGSPIPIYIQETKTLFGDLHTEDRPIRCCSIFPAVFEHEAADCNSVYVTAVIDPVIRSMDTINAKLLFVTESGYCVLYDFNMIGSIFDKIVNAHDVDSLLSWIIETLDNTVPINCGKYCGNKCGANMVSELVYSGIAYPFLSTDNSTLFFNSDRSILLKMRRMVHTLVVMYQYQLSAKIATMFDALFCTYVSV